jgi:hypothetical protein
MVLIKRKLLCPDYRKCLNISEETKESSERQISERRIEHKAVATNHHTGPFQAGSQETTENHAIRFDTAVNARPEHCGHSCCVYVRLMELDIL